MTAKLRDRSGETRAAPTSAKCVRCSKVRQTRSKGYVNPLCSECKVIVKREANSQAPRAVCLVTFARIERWHKYDRLASRPV